MAETDAELVRCALAGDRAASDKLMRRYWKQIGVFVYQKLGPTGDWEDILQDIFTKALRSLDNLRSPERFGAWLYTVAASGCMDYLRRRQRRPAPGSLDEAPEPVAPATVTPLDREAVEVVRKAVAELPDKYRVVITLRFLKGMNAKEIAGFLGEPAGTVRNRIFRANRMLEEKLKGYL